MKMRRLSFAEIRSLCLQRQHRIHHQRRQKSLTKLLVWVLSHLKKNLVLELDPFSAQFWKLAIARKMITWPFLASVCYVQFKSTKMSSAKYIKRRSGMNVILQNHVAIFSFFLDCLDTLQRVIIQSYAFDKRSCQQNETF